MRKKSPETTRKIIEATRDITLEAGLKATTMEAIATRAGIAKGTLYAYFPDKDAVISALIDALAEDWTDAFAEAFADEGEIGQRVGRGLAAKFGAIAQMLDGSAFAHDLIGEHHRLAAADAAVSEEIITALKAAGIAESEQLVPVLIAASTGLLMKFSNADDVRAGITLMCERMVR